MNRFVLLDFGRDDDGRLALYETDGAKTIRLVATDGGEPEDQTFGRDWSWVLDELNKLAAKVAALESAPAPTLAERYFERVVEALKRRAPCLEGCTCDDARLLAEIERSRS